MKYIILIILGICLNIPLSAQKTFDLITLSGRFGFPQSYDVVYNGKAKEYGAMVNLAAPIKFSEKSMWFNSLNYFYWHISDNEKMPIDIATPANIHGIVLRTGLVQKLSGDREIQILFVPRLMSDFKNINGNHFQFGGIVLYKKKFSDKLTMAFGALYNQEFFGPYMVPLVDLDWQISNRWSISGLLPIYSKIKCKINDRFNAGIFYSGLMTTYRLGDSDYEGDYIERKSVDLTMFARYRIGGNLYVEGRFGHTLSRSYAQYEADQKVDFSMPLIGSGDDRFQKNVNFRNGLITELRLVYSISVP